jgi:hypothetical protein
LLSLIFDFSMAMTAPAVETKSEIGFERGPFGKQFAAVGQNRSQ